MEQLYVYGLFGALLAGAATGTASCVSLHCSTNLDVYCGKGDVCSLCNDRDKGCRPRGTVTANCLAFPDEEGAEGASSSEGDETSTGGEGDSSSTSGSDGSMSGSAGMTSSTTTTSSSTSNVTNSNNPFCGNGEIEVGEECDDQNFDDEDLCISCKLAFCGDGHVSPEEECDDQNYIEDDGCNNECARDRVVFVTSSWHTGMLSGMIGAINACRGLAITAGLDNDFNFYPWLSDGETSPSTLFFRSRGRYVLPDMVTVIADDWDDLVDGELQNPINLDENGELLDGPVWTNTLASGENNPLQHHCGGWKTTEGYGKPGFTSQADMAWTETDYKSGCGGGAHLYCFEQE